MKFKTLILILFILNLSNLSYILTETKIHSSLYVEGESQADSLIVNSAEIKGVVTVKNTVKSSDISSQKIINDKLTVEIIKSPNKVLTIEGDLVMINDVQADSINSTGTSFSLEGIKQWQLHHHEDFEKEIQGWSDPRINRCTENGNAFLGGHCHFAGSEVSKTYSNLPEHSKLRLTALYHMFDSWDGEAGYVKINDVIVWTKKSKHEKGGLSVCGGEHSDLLGQHVDVSLPHKEKSVKITFGSTLDESPCNESYGVDDVSIYVK